MSTFAPAANLPDARVFLGAGGLGLPTPRPPCTAGSSGGQLRSAEPACRGGPDGAACEGPGMPTRLPEGRTQVPEDRVCLGRVSNVFRPQGRALLGSPSAGSERGEAAASRGRVPAGLSVDSSLSTARPAGRGWGPCTV